MPVGYCDFPVSAFLFSRRAPPCAPFSAAGLLVRRSLPTATVGRVPTGDFRVVTERCAMPPYPFRSVHAVMDKYSRVGNNPRGGKYLYTAIIFHQAGSLYYLRTSLKGIKPQTLLSDALQRIVQGVNDDVPAGEMGGRPLLVDPALVFPKFPTGYVTAEPKNVPGAFFKRPVLCGYGDEDSRNMIQNSMESEVRVLELLRHNPHPNIVSYLGCVVKDGLIVGTLFEKLDMDLSERCLDKSQPFDVDKCMLNIRSALDHLHSMRYCHNDVKMSNVMVQKDDTAVLIDFDSCLPIGKELGKGCTFDWGNDNATVSSMDNDERAFDLLDTRLREAVSTAVPVGRAAGGEGRASPGGGAALPVPETAATAGTTVEEGVST